MSLEYRLMHGIPPSPARFLAVFLTATGLFFQTSARALESVTTPVGELLKVQAQVQSRLDGVLGALVAVESDDGAASGVIISADGLVMTAAHVTTEPGKRIHVILSDGRRVPCKTLGLDKSADAAMMRLDGDRHDWPFLPLCRDVTMARPGSWCFAVGHPGGYDKKRGPVLRVGKILKQAPNMLQSDCVLMGGDSGGPLLNLDGEVIGIHSQIWAGRDQNMHISVTPFLRSWDDMKKSEIVHSWGVGAGGWLGVATRISAKAELEVAVVAVESPAAKAGLVSGDVIKALDGLPMFDQPQFSSEISSRAAGETIALRVVTKSGERVVEMKLAARPKD